MHNLARNGKCCGRKPQHYKSKGQLYCHKCNYSYHPETGASLGYFGSGKSKAAWHAEIRTFSAEFQVQEPQEVPS